MKFSQTLKTVVEIQLNLLSSSCKPQQGPGFLEVKFAVIYFNSISPHPSEYIEADDYKIKQASSNSVSTTPYQLCDFSQIITEPQLIIFKQTNNETSRL